MELKHNNLNVEIVIASELNPRPNNFFWKIVRIALKNECYNFFFQEDAYICPPPPKIP